ncbi:hypothetical protein [Paenibacillus pini]|uniref:Uncharacterized protein n=1 Tax=Paenibacillus pini JCM 16418 TaxID=1236976 RepID=W7Y6J2_9BACL|nr:hypothetical protein [Paenibacillus pini]GAF06525.1 hypothetical protein JCM16418_484 [Paenibacillus pini JCM 16418]
MKRTQFTRHALWACIFIVSGAIMIPATAQAKPTVNQAFQHTGSSTKNYSQTSKVPAQLESFSENIVRELSHQPAFASWARANINYYSLGPGTHGWFAAVMQNERQIGYMIISASEDGGFILSEYGDESSLPYSFDLLHNRLKQEHLMTASTTIPKSLDIEVLYTPLLPVWRVTPKGQESIYIHAITAEILPTAEVKINLSSMPLTSLNAKGVQSNNNNRFYLNDSSFASKGKGANHIYDPYNNMLWLTAPKLEIRTNSDFKAAMKDAQENLVFLSPHHNAAYGAPFAISGLQSWSTTQGNEDTVYAATGAKGKRFVPLSLLVDRGEFRSPMVKP